MEPPLPDPPPPPAGWMTSFVRKAWKRGANKTPYLHCVSLQRRVNACGDEIWSCQVEAGGGREGTRWPIQRARHRRGSGPPFSLQVSNPVWINQRIHHGNWCGIARKPTNRSDGSSAFELWSELWVMKCQTSYRRLQMNRSWNCPLCIANIL